VHFRNDVYDRDADVLDALARSLPISDALPMR